MTDDEFLKNYCGDVWTETLSVPEGGWVPKGTLFISSGQKLQMTDRKDNND